MSKTFTLQSGDDAIVRVAPDGLVILVGRGVPTNGQPGIAKGAMYINLSGSVGSLWYGNTGSTTSSTWTNVL